MKPKIVVIGSANTDMVVKVDHLPTISETVLGSHFVTVQGGKGANQAVAAARLGAEVTFVARLGRDTFGRDSLAAYQAEGINTDYIVWDDEAPSGVALVMVNQVGEDIIAVAPGANGRLSPADVMAAEGAIKEANCVLLQLEVPLQTVETAAELAYNHGVRVILNPAPATQLSATLLRKVDTLTPNETEASMLAGGFRSSHAKDIAYLLLSKSGVKNMIITLGREGTLIAGTRNVIVPAFSVKSIDATGAEDAFNSGLAVALARGDGLMDAVRYANAAGALATTRMGAQPSLPTAAEVETFLQTAVPKAA